jgi:hypothetical protein
MTRFNDSLIEKRTLERRRRRRRRRRRLTATLDGGGRKGFERERKFQCM